MKLTLLASEKGIGIIKILVIAVIILVFFLIVYGLYARGFPILPRQIETLLVTIVEKTLQGVSDFIDWVRSLLRKIGQFLQGIIRYIQKRYYDFRTCRGLTLEEGREFDDDIHVMIRYAKENGFRREMERVEALITYYRRPSWFERFLDWIQELRGKPPTTDERPWWRETNWCKVEEEFWSSVETRTFTEIARAFNVFRIRTLGCGDITPLIQMAESIVKKFNNHTLEDYIEAKRDSQRLRRFTVADSNEFIAELLKYLTRSGQYLPVFVGEDGDWFKRAMLRAITKSDTVDVGEFEETGPSEEINNSRRYPPYPEIINDIDHQANRSNNLLQRAFADTVIAEIYLNHNLLQPAEDRYEEAIRAVTKQTQFVPRNIDLHMALGLLHDRVCKNEDLAIKAFKEAVTLARQAHLECHEDYATAHFYLGELYLNIRPRITIEVPFTYIPILVRLQVIPLTSELSDEQINQKRALRRREIEKARETKEERDQRLREEYEDRQKIVRGYKNPRAVRQIGDPRLIIFGGLVDISVDSAREFEEFLICQARGAKAEHARYFHRRYLERLRGE